ncbi:MAG TPA: HGGxSTG domain-containing protein [Gammaproteobacteria bacterium]|nr:HGGxSTG domain-containing protein [Gammaproteobacteria bacterium]
MSLGYDWCTDTIGYTPKTPRAKRGDWPRCRAHCQRDGQPCQARTLANGRCKYHGGLSTGPRTPAGKARALANLKQFRKW